MTSSCLPYVLTLSPNCLFLLTPSFYLCVCQCTVPLRCVGGCTVALLRVQTLSSVQQLVDIEPSPVSAMRMTLAQVVTVLASIPILISNRDSSIMNVLLDNEHLQCWLTLICTNNKPSTYSIEIVPKNKNKKKKTKLLYLSANYDQNSNKSVNPQHTSCCTTVPN